MSRRWPTASPRRSSFGDRWPGVLLGLLVAVAAVAPLHVADARAPEDGATGSVPTSDVGGAEHDPPSNDPDPPLVASPEASTEPLPAATPAMEPAGEPLSGEQAGERFLVTYRTAAGFRQRGVQLSELGLVESRSVPALRLAQVVLPASAAGDALAVLRRHTGVASVEPDRQRKVSGEAADPRYQEQWALPVIGWPGVHAGPPPPGTAIVALLDTGVDATHPELVGQLVRGAPFVDGAASDADANGHGTQMAGIVAARTGNGEGIAGVGFAGVRVMPVTVLDQDGVGWDSAIIEGIAWALDHGADVILMPFAGAGSSIALQAAIEHAWERGAVVVAAVGNEGADHPTYPAAHRGVIGVAATTRADAVWPAGNRGAAVFMAAPGAEVLTTLAGGGYGLVGGTSAAAAHVAAAAALLRAREPALSNGSIVGRLARTAAAMGTQNETGNGRLDLARAWAETDLTEVKPAGATDDTGGPFVGPYVAAATCSSQNGGGNWNTSSVWSCGRVPGGTGVNDTAVITTGNPVTVTAANSGAANTTALTLNANATLTINSGVTLSISGTGGNVSVSGTLVNRGTLSQAGTLTVNNGGTYQHDRNGGTIPAGNYNTGSLLRVSGVTTSAPTLPGSGVSGSVEWNSTGQTGNNLIFLPGAANNPTTYTIGGNFSVVSTGSGSIIGGGNTARSLAIGGNLTVSGGTYNAIGGNGSAASAGNGNISIDVGGNLTISGGTFRMAIGESTSDVKSATLTVGGALTVSSGSLTILTGSFATSSAASSVTVSGAANLNGGAFTITDASAGPSSAVTVRFNGDLSFAGGTLSRGGTLTANVDFGGTAAQAFSKSSGTISGAVNFAILSGATVNFGSVLDGSGATFSLNSGGRMGITHAGGIAGSGAAGQIQVGGTRTYSTGGHYTYNGTGAQVTGTGLPGTVASLAVAKPSGTVTLTSSVTVSTTLAITGGTLDLGANTANRGSSGGSLTVGNGAGLRIGGSSSLPSNYSTHSIGATSTIEYAGTGAVSALNNGQSYGTLVVSGTVTSGSTSYSVATSLAVASGGTLTPAGGTVTMNNGSSISSSGTLTFRGLTIAAGATVTTSASFAVAGTLTVGSGATFAPASGSTITLTGTAWGIANSGSLTLRGLTMAGTPLGQTSASFAVAGTLTVNSGVTFAPAGGTVTLTGTAWGIVNSGTLTFRGLTIAGTPSSQPSASFAVAAALTVNTSTTFAPAAGSTITLDDGASIATSGSLAFQGLTVAASASVSGSGNFSVAGTFSISAGATYTPAAAQVISGAGTLAGSGTARVTRTASTPGFVNQYTIGDRVLADLTVEYAAAAAQTISALTYGHLRLNNPSGATLAGDVTVEGTLTLAAGNVASGASTLTIGASGSVSRTSGHVVGNLRRHIGTGSPTVVFDIGDNSAYAPVSLAFDSVTVAGTVTATTVGSDHPQVGDSVLLAAKSANRYWTLANSGTAFASYGATIAFALGDVDADAEPAYFVVGRYADGAWSYPAVGSAEPTSTQAIDLAGFGDFALAEHVAGGAFRSSGSGTWASGATWQRFNGQEWVGAAAGPTSSDGPITVRSDHVVTVAAGVAVDEVEIEVGAQVTVNGGVTLTIVDGPGPDLEVLGTLSNAGTVAVAVGASLIVADGGTYRHSQNGGTIPPATWAAASTIEITGWTSSTANPPAGIGQAYGNFTWNSVGQTANVSLAGAINSVAGTFSVLSTGSGSIALGGNGAGDLAVASDFHQAGGTFRGNFAQGSGAARTLSIGGSLTIAGGTFDVNGANTNPVTIEVGGDFVHTGGTLTVSGTNATNEIVFNGAQPQTFTSGGMVSGMSAGWRVAAGSFLQVAAATTVVDGSGSFTLEAGATLGIRSPDGITASASAGNIGVGGARDFSAAAAYVYDGAVAQQTGDGLPAAVAGLTIANAAGVTLTGSVTVDGELGLQAGVLVTGAYVVAVSATGSLGRTGGHVNGNLRRHVSASVASVTFEVGDASAYTPVFVAFDDVGSVGSLTLSTTASAHPALAGSPINVDRSAGRYWTLANDGITFDSYSAVLNFLAADVAGGADPTGFVAARHDGVGWEPTAAGTLTATSAQLIGLTGFGDLALGEERSLGDFEAAGDIGGPALAGYAYALGETYTVRGAGNDIWDSSDQFHFLYRALTGDGVITARVTSQQNTDPWAKAGVMIRDSLAPGSRHAMVVLTPSNGVSFQWRAPTGGSSSQVNQAGLSAPHWVRLVRNGNSFTAYRSADGAGWTQLGTTQTISMGAIVYVGLAVTSHNVTALSTATLTNVSLASLAAPTNLTATPVSTRRIDLAWQDNESDETGYEIDRTIDGSTWTPVTVAPADATSQVVSGLSPATEYTFRVRAIADPQWVADWYDHGWSFRKQVVIDGSKVSNSHADFPLLVSLIDVDLRDRAQASGNDILFTTAGGTRLDHEIERWTSSTGALIAWVRLPSLVAGANTALYLYYGNPSASDQQNPAGVWDSDYVGVWHLAETASAGGTTATHSDSTANANHGSQRGNASAGGIIGTGQDFDGIDDYIAVASAASLQISGPITISGWVRPRSHGTGTEVDPILRKGEGNPNNYQLAGQSGGRVALHLDENDGGGLSGASTMGTSEWYYLVGTWDGSTRRVYLNGVQDGTGSKSGPIGTDNRPLYIGGRTGATDITDGVVDEVRLSRVARSAGWILTEYNNQASPSTFYTVSAEEAGSTGQSSSEWAYVSASTLSAPVAVDDAYEVDEDGELVVAAPGLLANDPDGTNGIFIAAKVSDPASGTVTVNADGSFTYTPDPDYYGTDSFTYRVSDGSLHSVPATVTITVHPVNDAPSFVAGPDAWAYADDGAVVVADWATDISPGPANESGQEVWFGVAADAPGLFEVQPQVSSTGTLSYTPAVGAQGSALVTVVLHDDGGTERGGTDASEPQTFTITVYPPATFRFRDDAEGFVSSDGSGEPASGSWTGSSGNPPGSLRSVLAGASQSATHEWTLSGTWSEVFGVPADAWVTDVQLTSGWSRVTEYSTGAPSTVSRWDVRTPGGETVAALFPGRSVSAADGDWVSIGGDSQSVAAPYAAADTTIEVRLRNALATGASPLAAVAVHDDEVTIAVTYVLRPTATDDAVYMYQDGTLAIAAPGVLFNDTDPQAETLTVASPRPLNGPQQGSLVLNADGSFAYVPAAGFTGQDSFTYAVVNESGALSHPATVTISVLTTAYVSAAGWSTSFDAARYLALSFPAYVPAGATVEGAIFRHAYRSYADGTTCWYMAVYDGAALIATHGSAAAPLSCNSSAEYVTDLVTLPEVDSPARANGLTVRLYLANSAGGRSEHRLATLGVDYWLGSD